jgi:hypothetical protein
MLPCHYKIIFKPVHVTVYVNVEDNKMYPAVQCCGSGRFSTGSGLVFLKRPNPQVSACFL